jgi:hypothetical protein
MIVKYIFWWLRELKSGFTHLAEVMYGKVEGLWTR